MKTIKSLKYSDTKNLKVGDEVFVGDIDSMRVDYCTQCKVEKDESILEKIAGQMVFDTPCLKHKKQEEGLYDCVNCGEEWSFYPEDYESTQDYPEVCPHCSMGFWEMVKNVYSVGGLWEVFYWIKKRYF